MSFQWEEEEEEEESKSTQLFLSIYRGKEGKKKLLPGGESNPGLPRDRRRYSPLYYRGCGNFWDPNSLLNSLLLPTTISR